MSTPAPVQGRTAVVTGASSGIGAATALRLAADGWQVVAAARRVDRLGALAAQHPAIRPQPLDVTDAHSVAQLADAVPDCALVVANAGGALDMATLGEADVDDWARMYDLNVLGVVRTVQALLPQLRASRGQVVVTGSTAGRWTYEKGGGYVAAKHAVAGLREVLRMETVADGVRVSEVAPGMVHTEEFSLVRFERLGEQEARERAGAVYAGVDALTAEDVADAIAWVASRPAHVNIDLVQLTPQQQAAVHKVDRRPS